MRLSVQCFTLRDEFASDVDATLAEIRSIGFEYIETAGDYGLGASLFASKVRDAGLNVSGMHVGLDAVESGVSQTIEDAKHLGSPYLIVPWVSDKDYADGWGVLGQRLERAAGPILESGLQLAYHNHAFEFVRQPDGRTGFDTLFAAANPEMLKAEIDVWWAHCGDDPPAGLIKRHAGRTPIVHLKDGASCDDDVHRAAGDGVLDWVPILQACIDSGVRYGVVELDRSPGSAMEAVRKSYEFFAGLGFR